MDADTSPGPTTAGATTFIIVRPPPPFPAPPRSVDLSALEFILGLLAVISIPALIYTFFFALRCPRRHASAADRDLSSTSSAATAPETTSPPAPASEVKYSKEIHGKDLGDDCPVCLSAFGDGEDVKRLTACGHAFHAPCVDPWLSSHANCPVCRASVPGVKPSGGTSNSNINNNRNNHRSSRTREDDFHQGLPDASNLV